MQFSASHRILSGYRTTPLKSRHSMDRYSKYITPYKAPHTKIYSMNFIDFCCDI